MAMVEPWLRGTLDELDPLRRGVIHALWLAAEDVERWCKGLTDGELEARPFELPSVGFQLRHMVRSLDRLLTYAQGLPLDDSQAAALGTEMETQPSGQLFVEFEAGIKAAERRVKRFSPDDYAAPRGVGRKMLPTNVGGLLVHCADHTQRHAGQAVTTAKLLVATRGPANGS